MISTEVEYLSARSIKWVLLQMLLIFRELEGSSSTKLILTNKFSIILPYKLIILVYKGMF